jgi:hypothetical protein
MKNIKLAGEIVFAKEKAAATLMAKLAKLIKEKGYLSSKASFQL